jgi:hypothetical protein
MRGTLILRTASILLSLVSCGPVPPQKSIYDQPVAVEYLPPGFTQEQCHYVKPLIEGEPKSEGMNSMSADVHAAASQAPQHGENRGGGHPPIECSRPGAPTSGLPQDGLCSDGNGTLRFCGG